MERALQALCFMCLGNTVGAGEGGCCSLGVEPESWGSPPGVWRGCKSVRTAATELIHIYSSWSGFRNVWPCPSLCLALNIPGGNSCLAPGSGDRSPAWSRGKPLMRLTLVCFLRLRQARPCRHHTWMFISSGPVPSIVVAPSHNTLPVVRAPSWDIAVCIEGDGTGYL